MNLQLTQYAVDHVFDAVTFVARDGSRIYVNEATCQLTGYSRDELAGSKLWTTFPLITAEVFEGVWAEVKSRGTHVFESILRTRAGIQRSVEVSLTFIVFEEREIVFAIARDISARRLAQQALRESEERLRLTQFALDHARDLVSICDRDGRRLYVNETFCRFTGRSREELLNARIWDLVPSFNCDRFQAFWDDVKRCDTLTCEIELLTRSGELKPLEMSASYLNFAGKEAICSISRDLTARRAAELEKKRMQQQLQETQKLESLGVLAGGIAHDFNNLLTGVLGNASLARDRLADQSDLHEPLRHIERAAMRASELCQQMLAYAGKGRFVVEPLDLSRLVEETAKLLDLSIARRASLELKLETGLPSVLADSAQLRQIVMNLVLNAAEAINHPAGTITVTTGRLLIDRKFLNSVRAATELPEGEGVFLEVRDNGSGMDRETLTRIFEPFFTTKFTGRGLGLASVLGIVRSHRGALQVQSELGRGTTFRLVLAAHQQTAVPSRGTPPIFHVPKKNRGRLLIVDDEESVRSVSRQALERIGYTIDTAEDGEAALSLLRDAPAAYRVILLDYTMPKLDGAQTLREIRLINPGACVILMSGFPEQEARERLGDGVLAGFIQKPFDIGQLRNSVQAAVGPEGPAGQ
jgi:two-component system, cell cycle sensor histidine kinase and response regulator CckA